MDWCLDHILYGGHVRKQVKALKHKPYLSAYAGNVGLAVLNQPPVLLAIAHQLTFNIDAPIIDLLQVVDAAQQRRFTGAAWANNDHNLPTFYREINAVQDSEVAKAFDDLLGAYHLAAVAICLRSD